MIGIYIRVSGDSQLKTDSPTSQRKRGKLFAKSMNEDYEIYDEEAESGASMINRIALQRLFDDIAKGLINKVWVREQFRLVRDPDDAGLIKKHFLKYKCEFYDGGKLIDLKDRKALMMYRFQSLMDEQERLTIVESTQKGRNDAFDAGKRVKSNMLGYTYDWVEGKRHYIIDENQAQIVRDIFKFWCEGNITINKLKQIINHKYDLKMCDRDVLKMLNRIEYIGKTRNSIDEIIDSFHYQPIINIDTWNKAQILVKQNTVKKKDKQIRQSKDELSGVFKCFYCGEIYKYRNQDRKYEHKSSKNESHYVREIYYHSTNKPKEACQNSRKIIYRKTLFPVFKAVYRSIFFDQSQFEKWREVKRKEYEDVINQNSERQNVINKKLVELETQHDRLLDKVMKGILSDSDIASKKNEIAKEENKIKDDIAKMNKENQVKIEELENQTKMIYENIIKVEKLEPNQRKIIYKNILKTALIKDHMMILEFITGAKFEINYKYPEIGIQKMIEDEKEAEKLKSQLPDQKSVLLQAIEVFSPDFLRKFNEILKKEKEKIDNEKLYEGEDFEKFKKEFNSKRKD